MVMPALETLAGVAEQQGAGSHQLAACCGSVLKAARRYDGDGDVRVPLFERAVARSGGADDVGDRPAIALREAPRRGFTGSAMQCAPRQSPLQFDRNFCQDPSPEKPYNYFQGIETMNDFSLRHAVATLAYRGSKALRDAPAEFSGFRPGETSRSAGEILAHLGDLLDWALSIARGEERWHNSKPRSWSADTERFFAALSKFDEYLASGAELHAPAGKLFQGAIADSLTHVGQIAMMRRLAGARVRGENYYVAKIEVGRTGIEQLKPVMEFD